MSRCNHLFIYKRVFITSLIFHISFSNTVAQTIFKNSFYSNDENIPSPVGTPASYPRVKIGTTSEDVINQQNRQTMQNMGYRPPSVPPTDPLKAHQFILNEAKTSQEEKKQKQLVEIYTLLKTEIYPLINVNENQKVKDVLTYKEAFSSLMKMYESNNPFSIKKAVFFVENAWHGDKLNYQNYENKIEAQSKILNSVIQKEKIPEDDNLAKNYLIQSMFSQEALTEDSKHKPYRYDFEDFMGEIDWTKMFVSKLLNTNTGQCHSMPLLYLILAEEINAKAWLSLAPEHSFIIFNDGKTFFNFETTCGKVVSNEWLMQSGYITSAAIKNRLYLDTLGKDALTSTLIADLVMGYVTKFGYDDFVNSMVDTILTIHPKSIQGQIFKADILTLETRTRLKQAGNPPLESIETFPEAYASYQALLKQYDLIDALGYIAIPKEKYTTWIKNKISPTNGTH